MTMKTRITYCVIGANAAIEIVRVLKPPSATTDKAWPTASKSVMLVVEAGPAEERRA